MTSANATRPRLDHFEPIDLAYVAGYARMSKDATGEMLGVERQWERNDDLSQRNYDGPVRPELRFEDNDISAYKGRKRRPGFENLLAEMERGHIKVILVWHLDRLYRSLRDFARFAELAEKHCVIVKTVTGGDLDFGSPTGRAIAGILTLIAELESAHKGERQVLANTQKAQRGEWQSANRTFGYTMAGEPLEPEASAVRKAAVDVLAGKSIQGVAREWKAAGLVGTRGRPFNAPGVRRVLMNPRYAAIKTHQGKVIGQGTWTALIDADTHKGLVAYLSDPSRVTCTSFERKYIGSGLYVCGLCGGSMKASMPGSSVTHPNNRKSRAYVCRDHSHLLRQGEPLDDYVTGWVIERLSKPKAHLLLDNQVVDLRELDVRREALISRKDGVRRAHNNGSLTEGEYLADLADLSAQIAECDAASAAATRTSPAASLVAAGHKIGERWLQMSPTERAQAVDEVAVVTILPCIRDGRKVRGAGFDSAFVDITPKR